MFFLKKHSKKIVFVFLVLVLLIAAGLFYFKIINNNSADKFWMIRSGDLISIHYKARTLRGLQFDSTGDTPFTFLVGAPGIVPGLNDGVIGMYQGLSKRLVIPPERAYGSKGVPGVVGPNATVIFEVQIISVTRDNQPIRPPEGYVEAVDIINTVDLPPGHPHIQGH